MDSTQLTTFLTILNESKLFHWQTRRDVEHRYLGQFYDELGGLVDQFVESAQSDGQRIPTPGPVVVRDYAEGAPMECLHEFLDFLTDGLADAIASRSDLSNLRDEMLGLTNRTLFLLTEQ